MKKYVFESLKFFCAAILCTILSAFTSPSWGANCNLFDVSALQSGTNGGVTLSVASDGEITVNGATELAYYSSFVANLPTPLTAGTYTLSLNNSQALPSGPGNIVGCVVNNAIGQRSVSLTAPNASGTFVVDEGTQCERIEIRIKGPADNFKFKIKLEKGSTATPYQPYNPLCATCNGTIVNYTSATGTVSQSGTPTPDNPIEPTFYKQGNMVLRKVGDYADSYDATTGKITRRVGVKVLDGTEGWQATESHNFSYLANILYGKVNGASSGNMSTHFPTYISWTTFDEADVHYAILTQSSNACSIKNTDFENGDVAGFKSWLAAQYAAGTPVVVYYPLAEPVEEDWTETSYCETPIKIATTKYNETKFSPLNTALANAISVVDTVVSNTITQAGRIATLQAQKQTRPNDIADDNEKCPAGKKCLLVTDTSGIPHWYEIVERYSLLPDGYTELQYIESTGTQYIDTGVTGPARWVGAAQSTSVSDKSQCILGADYVNNSAYSASVYLASQIGSSGVVWRLGSALSTVVTTDYAEYDVNFAETSFSGTINGESLSVSGVSGFTNWYIGMDRGTSSIYYFIGKIYTQKAYQNDTLVRDMIPAKDAGGVIGMYDTVNNRFYTNAGTGEFIAGDPVAE